ncbi:MAG: hypothetical protein H6735_12125 [Alphaproteobacteria bacterium]|nr:hypothetical protein [Alphaproteobacteria bacterium]
MWPSLWLSVASAQDPAPTPAPEVTVESAAEAPTPEPSAMDRARAWQNGLTDVQRRCWVALTSLFPESARDGVSDALDLGDSTFPCRTLANDVAHAVVPPTTQQDPALDQYREFLLRPRNPSSASSTGIGQVEAAPSVTPQSAAGAGVALTGTAEGARAIGVLTINPLGLGSPTGTRAGLAAWRTLDVSLLVPVDGQTNEVDTTVDYAGVRVRANLLAPFDSKGAETVDAALKELKTTITSRNALLGAEADEWEAILMAAPDTLGCARAGMSGDEQQAALSCGQARPDTHELVEQYERTHAALADVSSKLEDDYLGLDLRYDHGDPTFSGDAAREGDTLVGLVALGARAWKRSTQIRANGGMYYFSPASSPDEPAFAAQGAVSLHLASASDDPARAIEADLGLQGRVGLAKLPTDPADLVGDPQFLDLVLGASIPTATGTRVAVGYRLPLSSATGTRTPTLTITGDWSLLPSLR